LAKEASKLDLSESVYSLFLLSLTKKFLRSRSLLEWDKGWKSSTKAMHTKNFFPSIYDRIKAKNFKPNFISTQFISSDGHFKSYLVRFHISDDYLCDCGKAIETPLHLILNCDQYINERQQLIYEAKRVGFN